jgi:hypothetical protein
MDIVTASGSVTEIEVATSDGRVEKITREYLGQKWTLVIDIFGADNGLISVKIPYDYDTLYIFYNLNHVMDCFSEQKSFKCKLISYTKVEQIARFFSPIDNYWKAFCANHVFSANQCVELGALLRSKPMPSWFKTEHVIHKNFNLQYDPIYTTNDSAMREKYLEIEWLNLATYLIWNAWVNGSYESYIEVQHVDWCCVADEFGDAWRVLKPNVEYTELITAPKHMGFELGVLSKNGFIADTTQRYDYTILIRSLTEDEKSFVYDRMVYFTTHYYRYDMGKTFNQLVFNFGLNYLLPQSTQYDMRRYGIYFDYYGTLIVGSKRFVVFMEAYAKSKNTHPIRFGTYPSHSIKSIACKIATKNPAHVDFILKIASILRDEYIAETKIQKFIQCLNHFKTTKRLKN